MQTIKTLNYLVASLLLLTLSACVPMGLPEYFSPFYQPKQGHLANIISQTAHNNPVALIVFNGDKSYTSINSATTVKHLGSQYLLGIFPFTSLYLQHTLDSLLIEKTINNLKVLGYQSHVTHKKNVKYIASLLQPNLVISPTFKTSINAYDLIFFRLLSLKGWLKVNFLDANGNTMHSETLPIHKHNYKRTGFAPLLAQLLESSLDKALEEILKQTKSPYFPKTRLKKSIISARKINQSKSVRQNNSPNLLAILPTIISNKEAKLLTEKVHLSYGFNNTPMLSMGATSRLFQRGLEEAAKKHKITAVSSHPPLGTKINAAIPNIDNFWYLTSETTKVSILNRKNKNDYLKAEMTLTLYQRNSHNKDRLISLKRCHSLTPVERGVDGYWAVTIEKASLAMGESFFTSATSSTNSSYCEDIPL